MQFLQWTAIKPKPLSRRLPASVTLLRCGWTFPSQPLCATPNSEVSPPGSGWTASVLLRLQTGVYLRGCLWSQTELCCGWSLGCIGNEEPLRCRIPAAAVGVPVMTWWHVQRWCWWSWCLHLCAGGGMLRKYSGAHSSDKVAGCKSEGCQEWKKEKVRECRNYDNIKQFEAVLLMEASSFLQARWTMALVWQWTVKNGFKKQKKMSKQVKSSRAGRVTHEELDVMSEV